MAHIRAFVVITLLIWAAVSVFGTTTELSTTAGDTVNIACLFGEGTPINIYWYYNNGIERQKLLFLAKGNISLGEEYANRASLQDDNLTLILENITVVDVGTYCCDVDRQGQIPVQNINTKLNVFSLRPDTLPVITPCTGNDEFSSCSIHANQSFTLTCTLPNVYPVQDTELIWFQDGQRVLFTNDFNTQNDDGTTDISRQTQVSKTGNFTCYATYLSANGSENTAASVEAWIIIPPTNVPETPGKDGKTVRNVTIGIVLSAFVIFLAIILICLKKRGQCCFRKVNKKKEETELNQVEGSTLLPSSTVPQGAILNSSEQIVTEKQLRILAGRLSAEKSKDVAINLGVSSIEHENTQLQNQSSIKNANFTMLMNWMRATGGKITDLDKALQEANCGGIEYKDV